MLARRLLSNFATRGGVITEPLIEPSPDAVFLYNLGDECTDVSGGWTYAQLAGGGSGENTITKNADHIALHSYVPSYAGRGYLWGPDALFNLDAISYIYIDFSSVGITEFRNGFKLGSTPREGWGTSTVYFELENGVNVPKYFSDHWQHEFNTSTNGERKVLKFDVTTITGEWFLTLATLTSEGDSVDFKLYRMWYEP